MPVPSYLKFAKRIVTKRHALPHYLVFFVTKNCTARCLHCLLGERAESRNELTVDEIARTTEHMDPILFLLITGGDPFIRDDISQIVQTFYKRPGFRNLGMPSNGYHTGKMVQAVEEILVTCKGIDFALDISIDGIGEDHDRIRQVDGLFDRAVNTYRELHKLKSRFTNFNLNVAVTVSHYNQDKLDDLYDFLRNELQVETINHLLCRGEPRNPKALDVDLEKYKAFSDRLDEDMKSSLLKGYHGYPFADMVNGMKMVRQRIIQTITREKRYVVPCYAGKLGTIMYPDGDIAPCELRSEILGNLRKENYNFRKIMTSPEADAFRNRIDRERCFCTYECFLTNAVMFNPLMFGHVILESMKIKWARFASRGDK